MKKFGKFLKKAKGVLGDKGKDIGQLALKAATGDFKGVIKEVGDILNISDHPEAKALSEEFKIKIKEFELEHNKLLVADRDSARDMQKSAFTSGDKFASRFVYYLAIFWSIIGATFIIMVFFVSPPEQNLRLVDTLEGFLLGTIVSTIIGYFFGGVIKNKED
tara:strand:- start:11709 stop:12194 length:486 start_codon:yes stop_codon:yes gene_type:complete